MDKQTSELLVDDGADKLKKVMNAVHDEMMANQEWKMNTDQRLNAIDASIKELKESVQSLIELGTRREFSSFDPGRMKPYTEGDKRTVPAFIEEFENCTLNIQDEFKKGSYFRRLFHVDNYPKSASMPRNVTYEVMKEWFLMVAWNIRAQEAQILQILKWTQESTGIKKIPDFVRYLNTKLIECDVSPRDRFCTIKDKIPNRVTRFLDVSDFETQDKLDVILRWMESRFSKEFLLHESKSESDEDAS